MFVVTVNIWIKPGFVDAFMAAILDNARNTRKERGNVRFDVLQQEDDPAHFVLYEAYHSKEGFTAHQQTEHYHRWKNAVTDWMAQPRQAVKCNSAFFGDG